MSERKVINKYIPPNFDPDDRFSMPRGPKRPKTVRIMVPFSLRCSTCGEFIYKGRKFNARKETVEGESYLGIPIFRFYIRCVYCSSEITYITDPQNADYKLELGATRNTEPWRDQEKETEVAKAKRRFEEEMNPMKALENKSIDTKREIDMAEAIEDLRLKKEQLERIQNGYVVERSIPLNEPAAFANPKPDPLPDLTLEEEEQIKKAFSSNLQSRHLTQPLNHTKQPKFRLDLQGMGVKIVKPKQPQ